MSLDSNTGSITLTSEVTGVTEHTQLELTAMAQDHGEPPLNAKGESSNAGEIQYLETKWLDRSSAFMAYCWSNVC